MRLIRPHAGQVCSARHRQSYGCGSIPVFRLWYARLNVGNFSGKTGFSVIPLLSPPATTTADFNQPIEIYGAPKLYNQILMNTRMRYFQPIARQGSLGQFLSNTENKSTVYISDVGLYLRQAGCKLALLFDLLCLTTIRKNLLRRKANKCPSTHRLFDSF